MKITPYRTAVLSLRVSQKYPRIPPPSCHYRVRLTRRGGGRRAHSAFITTPRKSSPVVSLRISRNCPSISPPWCHYAS